MPRALSSEDIDEFRERLCDAAERLFAGHGLEAVTMRQLAAELGVSPMTPYRYFKDKDDILAAVQARGFDRHAEALERAFFDTEGDALAKTTAAGEAYVRFALENPDAYRLMFDADPPGAKAYPDLDRAKERSRRTMTRHIHALQAAGLLDGHPDLIGHMYWVALHGAIMLHLAHMLSPPYDLMTILRAITATLSASLMRPAAPA